MEEKFRIILMSFAASSVALVYFQFRKNLEWNKKQLTAVELNKYVEANKESREVLNNLIDYASRYNTGVPFTDSELHIWMCEHTMKDGNINFTREDPAKEHPYKLKVIAEKRDNDGNIMEPAIKIGSEIKGNTIKILNNYELIAINVLNGAFDEKMTRDAFYNGLITHYNMYKGYIEHLRGIYHYNDDKAFEHFEWLANKWGAKNKKVARP
jgi:hypothetical protein